MFKKIMDNHADVLAGLADALNPEPDPSPAPTGNGGHTVVDRGNYTVVTVQNPESLYLKQDTKGDGVIDYFRGDEIVVNGPLFNDQGKPVGGYIKDGIVQQPFVTPQSGGGNFADNNGVIGQKKDGSKFLLNYDQWTHKNFNDADVAWAFQNGPILEMNGNNPHSPSTARRDIPRTALGFNAAGDMVIIASKGPSNMFDMGEALKKEGAVGGIFLDGANVGYLADGKQNGNMVDGSTTIHITTKKETSRSH